MSDRHNRDRTERRDDDERRDQESDDYGRSPGRGNRREHWNRTAEEMDRAQRRNSRGMGSYGPDYGYRSDYPQGQDQRDSEADWQNSGSYGRQQQRGSQRDQEDFGEGTGGYGNQSGFGNAQGHPGEVGAGIGRGGQGWMGEGPHAGRGPKGYRRSDERIMEEVCERLTQHRAVDASEIEVTVNNGEVTLSGNIDNRNSKRTAESILDDIAGITDVHNQLRVRRNEEGR